MGKGSQIRCGMYNSSNYSCNCEYNRNVSYVSYIWNAIYRCTAYKSVFYESWENAEIHNDKTVYDYAAWGIYLIFFTGIDRNYGCIKIYI